MEAGTAKLVDGVAPEGTDYVVVSWTAADGTTRTKTVPVKEDGTWSRDLDGLALGKTTVHLEAFSGDESVAESEVEVDLAVSDLTATGEFSADVDEVAHITGTASPNTSIVAFHGDRPIQTTMTDAEGKYSLAINPPNIGGPYDVRVEQHIRGEVASMSDVQLDYGAGVSISSPSNEDTLDPDEALAVRGQAQAGTKLKIFEAGKPDQPLKELVAGTNGYATVIQGLEDREYKLVVQGVSKGYNVTSAEVTINPGKSTVKQPTAQVGFDADVTQKAVVSGEGAEGATITVKDGAKTLGTASVADGKWSLPIDPIGPGQHTLTVEQTGIDGTQTTTAVADFGDAVEISGPTGTVTPGVVSVTGTGQDGATVTVTGGAEPVTTRVEDGTFSAEIELAPSDSAKTLTAQQRSKGNLSTSDSITVTPNGAQTPQAVDITEPSSHTYKPNHETTVKGTATPYAKIELRFQWNDTVYGTAKADKNGDWSINRAFGPASTYELTATQTRVDGTTSASTRFTLAPEDLTNKEVVIAGPADHHYTPGEQTRVTGTATPYAKIELRFQWNDTVYGRATADANGNWNIIRSYGPTATYELTATQIRPDDSRSLSNTFTLAPTGVDLPFSLTTPAKESTFEPGTDVRFTGTGTRGATVTAIAPAWNNNTIFQTKVDESGHWEIRRSFAPGITYDLTLVQQPADGDPTSITGIRLTPSS
ncbi:hypothetical protein C1N91_02075 [Curtobacterium sp. SGAir0471]|nr:hypothetical protein C1N91_02075 [Curtobacterium sp. SGAir0471]